MNSIYILCICEKIETLFVLQDDLRVVILWRILNWKLCITLHLMNLLLY